MGGVVSGAALPEIANRVVSASVGPYVSALVFGDWGAAFAVFMGYQALYAATNGWASIADRGDDTVLSDLQATTGLANGYYIILTVIGFAFAVLGWFHGKIALSPGIFPHHAWPLAHVFEPRPDHRPSDDSSPRVAGGLTAPYLVTSFIFSILVAFSSWLPYEMTVRFAPGGGTSVWAPIVGSAAPSVGILVFAWLPWVACGPSAHVFRRKNGALDCVRLFKALGVAMLLAAIVAVPVALVAYFVQDFDWTWTTAAIVGAVYVLAGLALSVFCGCYLRRSKKKGDEAIPLY